MAGRKARITSMAAMGLGLGGFLMFTVSEHTAHAESAIEFFINEAKRLQQPHFSAPRSKPKPPAATSAPAAASSFDRLVCTRLCDGKRLVMAIRPTDRDHHRYRSMCQAAGGDARTHFAVERLTPIAAPAAMASGPVMEGRAATESNTQCPAQPPRPLAVPIFSDATLRQGDVVAMDGEFRVFVGNGSPPFSNADFAPLGKNLTGHLKGMRAANAASQKQ